MKVQFALISLASASTMDWMMTNWWEEAKNVFNFANTNWDTFKSVADGVGEEKYTPLWNFCNKNGNDAISTSEFIECGKEVSTFFAVPVGMNGLDKLIKINTVLY